MCPRLHGSCAGAQSKGAKASTCAICTSHGITAARTRSTDRATSSTSFLSVYFSFAVGEATAGKASRSLAQHIPGSGGIEGVRGAAGGVIGDLTRARIALDERGQKLGELDERTASMMASAEAFSKHAHEVGALAPHTQN